MTISRTIVAAVLLLLIGVFGTLTYYYGLVVLETRHVPILVEVREENVFGFNTTNQSLNFGKVPPYQKQVRYVDISNTYSHPIQVHTRVRGDLAEITRVTPATITLEPQQNVTLHVQLVAPGKSGNYTSTLLITLKKP